jgi:hypothetical protein
LHVRTGELDWRFASNGKQASDVNQKASTKRRRGNSMRSKNFYYATLIVGITAVLTIGITLKLSRSRSATPVQPASTASLVARTTKPADEYRGAQKEGIKVHGHWTIDVRNPDGTLVTHSEFENALTAGGAATLSAILTRSVEPGFWRVILESGGTSPWNTQSGVITEQHDPFPLAPHVSKNLSICLGAGGPCTIASVPQRSGPPAGTFLLGGNIPAQQNGTIDAVATWQNNNFFTEHALAPLVNGSCPPNTQCSVHVVAGQIVQVTVVISFS